MPPFHTDDQLINLLQAEPWHFNELASHGTPLVAHDTPMMTFLFKAPEAETVHLWINRLTDKERFELGVMKHVPGTNFWVRTIAIPHTLMASYCFQIGSDVQHPPGYNNYPHHLDPHARSGQLIMEKDRGLSLLLGKDAQVSPWWHEINHGHALHNRLLCTKTEQCNCYLYLPPTNTEATPLVLLSDAEVWFLRLKLDQALDRAIATGHLPPVAVAAVGFTDSQHRRRLLTNFDAWYRHLHQSVIPWAQQKVNLNGQIILAGQSLGGLAALAVGLAHPQDFSAIIAQSPSLWWHDSPDASPQSLPHQVIPWLVNETLTQASPRHPKTYLDVGIREGLSVAHMHGLSDAMTTTGWQHELSVVDGGHDYAWWRETFLNHLHTCLPPLFDTPSFVPIR